jgi:hypothetical protein
MRRVREMIKEAHDEFKNKPFLSTGSFFQTLGKFNQNASQKESVLMLGVCLMEKMRKGRGFIIGSCKLG